MRTIRASMLPGYNDCPRRAAAKQYPELLRSIGCASRPMLPSIGAAVGTATHAAAEVLFRARMADPGASLDVLAAVAVASEKLREEIATGAEWDATTPNLQAAEYQLARLVQACLPLVVAEEPAAVELHLRARVAEGWELTGHVDLLTQAGHLDDLKTGSVKRPYQAQLGAYSLLARANGLEIRSVGITWVQRGRRTKPQPPMERYRYEVESAERAAWATAQAICRDVEAFETEGDPEAFRANPMSLMCSRRYCPAFGTPFCSMHPAEERDHVVD